SLIRRSLAAALVAVLSFSPFARAQAPPAVTPPVVQGTTDVPYPVHAHGDAVVFLDLVVDKDGRVRSATGGGGAEPFAEHARRAVLAWRFTPARRGDVPIVARIRARVDFHREEAPEAPDTPAQAAMAQAAEEPDEVTVRGRRREIGQVTLSAPEVR